MPGEKDAQSSANEEPLVLLEGYAFEVSERRHHPPDLPGVMPGEIGTAHCYQGNDQHPRVPSFPERQGDVRDEYRWNVDRRPLVLQDRGTIPVDDAIRRHEV